MSESIYLRHHAEAARVAMCGRTEGMLTEMPDGLPVGQKTGRGFFADTMGVPVGVYASPKGPILAYGDRHLRLIEGECKGAVLATDDTGRFTLTRRGHDPIEIAYPVPDLSLAPLFEPWETEEDMDFFRWLTARMTQPLFFSHYRLSRES